MKLIIALALVLSPFTFALETVEGAKKDIETFKNEMSVKLEKADEELKQLRDQATSKHKSAFEKAIAEYEESRGKLLKELNALKADSKEEWKTAKSRISKALDELNKKIQKTLNE